MSSLLNRRNSAADIATRAPCQRCKRYEIDLATAKDNLNAIDTELKASRQVISLLQRQLELFQVKKEGLERLIVSQSKSALDFDAPQACESSRVDRGSNDDGETISSQDISKLNSKQESDTESSNEGKLLSLIRTQLYLKDEEILKLRSNLKEVDNEKEQVVLQKSMLEDDMSKLKSEITLIKENLALRDQTIELLSAELFERSANTANYSSVSRRLSSADIYNAASEVKSQQKQICHLNDTLDAYKKTNRLLSTNVIKLTEKCNEAERKEIESRSQCHELEAKCCQIQSKLLSLLKEIEQSSNNCSAAESDEKSSDQKGLEIKSSPNGEFIQSESVRLLIRRLLEDKSLDIPLSWKDGNKSRRHKEVREAHKMSECDELGFYIVESDDCLASLPRSSPSTSSGLNKSPVKSLRRGFSEMAGSQMSSSNLDTVSEEAEELDMSARAKPFSVDARKRDEFNWRLKWDDFMTANFDNTDDLSKCKHFKDMLRSGVPQEYRCKVWKALVDMKIGKERQQKGADYYQSLLQPAIVKGSDQVRQCTIQNPSTKQIDLDLLRTLPNNKYFETIDSSGTVRLRRVLTAFSGYKPEVGYCQGMNRLAAVALLVLPEEEAFWCLAAIVDKIMPTGYYNDLWLAQVDSTVVMDLVAIKMARLSEHFKQHNIELSLFAWFLTIFVDGTPPSLFLRLWDCFLFEGDKVLFRAALALLKEHENELLGIDNSVAVNNFIRCSVNGPLDVDHFFEVAFNAINPLPGKLLRYKREQTFADMKTSYGGHRSGRTGEMSAQDLSTNHESGQKDSDERVRLARRESAS